MKYKNVILVAVVIILIFQIITIFQFLQSDKVNTHKPTVAISTFSLSDITKNITGDTVDVFMILPAGVDAHSYEPTPKEVMKLYKSDLVIYSGAGLEPWTTGFDFKNKAIDMSLHVKLTDLKHKSGNHNYTQVDPHYWLDLQNMIDATKVITAEFVKLFPQNKELYIKNRNNYIKKLEKIDSDYKEKLSTCKIDTIVVNHNAFSYLSNRYGFNIASLSGLSPETEPSAKRMVKLIEKVKEQNISTIFFESFASDKVITSVAKEANVNVDVLQPLGNVTADEISKNLSYEDIMRQNLEKILKVLICK